MDIWTILEFAAWALSAVFAALIVIDWIRTDSTYSEEVLTSSREGASRLSRIRDARRARWEDDLAGCGTDDVATLAALLGRLNRLSEARDTDAGAGPADG